MAALEQHCPYHLWLGIKIDTDTLSIWKIHENKGGGGEWNKWWCEMFVLTVCSIIIITEDLFGNLRYSEMIWVRQPSFNGQGWVGVCTYICSQKTTTEHASLCKCLVITQLSGYDAKWKSVEHQQNHTQCCTYFREMIVACPDSQKWLGLMLVFVSPLSLRLFKWGVSNFAW